MPSQAKSLAIDDPTDEQKNDALNSFFGAINKITMERRAAVSVAQPALTRLCHAMRQKTGQSYHIRGLLYSLWNGLPTDLSNVLLLDWALRQDVCAVILAFGFEEPGTKFFYAAIEDALKEAALLAWFLETEMEVAK